jgi:hypothetical protein
MRYDSAPPKQQKQRFGFVLGAVCSAAIIYALYAGSVFGALYTQQAPQQDIPAPPPVKKLSQQEISELDRTKDLKSRTRSSISFAESHLGNAEQLTTASQFDEASEELGRYRAAFEDALRYLDSLQDKSNRARDAYKRIELALRQHASRIETIRRVTPLEYAVNIKRLAEYTKDAREQALNAFYGDTVLHEKAPIQNDRDSEHGKGLFNPTEPKRP